MVPAVPPMRGTSASLVQSPSANAGAARDSNLPCASPRLIPFPRSTWWSTNSPTPKRWVIVTGRSSPALATRRWSLQATWMRSGPSGGSTQRMFLVSGRFFLTKPLSPKRGSVFSSLQGTATLILSVDWILHLVSRTLFCDMPVLFWTIFQFSWTCGILWQSAVTGRRSL